MVHKRYQIEPGTPGRVIIEMLASDVSDLCAAVGIGKQIGADLNPHKMEAAREMVAAGGPGMWPPCVAVDDLLDGDICLRVVEGRHRLAAMLETGARLIPLSVPVPTLHILRDRDYLVMDWSEQR